MTLYIALLRAINVGGRTVKMDRLRDLFEQVGFSAVETFIASGNVIFDAPNEDGRALEQQIEGYLREALGYEVATFIRTPAELAAVSAFQPFPKADLEGNTLYIGFVQASPGDDARQKLMALQTPLDEFQVNGRELYWLCRTSISQSAVSGAQIERALGVPTTLRNVTTVRKLAAKHAVAPTDDIDVINRNADRLNAGVIDALAFQVPLELGQQQFTNAVHGAALGVAPE